MLDVGFLLSRLVASLKALHSLSCLEPTLRSFYLQKISACSSNYTTYIGTPNHRTGVGGIVLDS